MENGQRTERPLKDRDEYQALLKQQFDIILFEEKT